MSLLIFILINYYNYLKKKKFNNNCIDFNSFLFADMLIICFYIYIISLDKYLVFYCFNSNLTFLVFIPFFYYFRGVKSSSRY